MLTAAPRQEDVLKQKLDLSDWGEVAAEIDIASTCRDKDMCLLP